MTKAKETINYILVAPENGPGWWRPDFSSTRSFEKHPSFLIESLSFSLFVHGQLEGLSSNHPSKHNISPYLEEHTETNALPHFCALNVETHIHMKRNCTKLLLKENPEDNQGTKAFQGRDFFAFDLGVQTWEMDELSNDTQNVSNGASKTQFLFLTTRMPQTNHGQIKLCQRVLEDVQWVDCDARNISILHSSMDILPF